MTKTRKLLEVEMLLLMKTCFIKTKLQNPQNANKQSEQVSLEEISESDLINNKR